MNRLIYLSLVILLMAACGGGETEPVERIRTIKTFEVSERASGQMRRFTGAVEAVDGSGLSFEVSGLVQDVRVRAGDRFTRGQVLAVLDKQVLELNVESARAALSRTEALNTERESAYERERRIQEQEPGATSQRAVDQARASYQGAQENVSYSRAQLSLARRDLASTELRAPFDGVVAATHVEAFEEVRRGQPVLDAFVEGAMEAAVSIPENRIGEVYVGLEGEVRLPNRANAVYRAVVSEVGSAATSANAFPIKATILEADERVRPGMTAELTLRFAPEEEGESGYLLPVQAIGPGLSSEDRHVFVFDPGTSTVRKTPIMTRGVLVGDQVIVSGGISPGDVIVIAGVAFLRDGQQVRLLNAPLGEASEGGEGAS